MSKEYCVPKSTARVRLLLVTGESFSFDLYLGRQAESHAGEERPSDVFNGDRHFIPLSGPDGRLAIVRRDAVMVASVAAEHETGPACGELTAARVEVTIENGTALRGTVTYMMPEGERRIQDHLNAPGRFLALTEGAMVHLINKARIVRLSAMESAEAAASR
ncbi:MAG TPA: hypothetical protein VJV23_16210 [Candidatus Polarisedimenticolia bacterium]|nr:hypothetical protein [Candidatus Polarisedimenticolia bacterium]